MNSVENPIARIFIRERVDKYDVMMTINVGEPFRGNYYDGYSSGQITVTVKDYLSKDVAEKLHQRLCEKFGIEIKVQKSKIKPVTFADMITEE